MEETAAYIKQLINIDNKWITIANTIANEVSLFDDISGRLENSMALLTEAINKLTINADRGKVNVNSYDTGQVINEAPTTKEQPILNHELEKLFEGTLKAMTKSGMKGLIGEEGEVFKDIFFKTFRKEMGGVAATFAGDMVTSTVTELGASELIAGGLGAVATGIGAVLAPEVVIGAMIAWEVGKMIFPDKPAHTNPSDIRPKIAPPSTAQNTEIIQGMLNRGEIEFPVTMGYENGKFVTQQSTIADFVQGKPTNIAFRDKGAAELFKNFNDPYNLENGWHYNDQLYLKQVKKPPISMTEILQQDVLRGLEKIYLGYGSRGEEYAQREIKNLRQEAGNGPYRPYLENVVKQYDAFVSKEKMQSLIQGNRQGNNFIPNNKAAYASREIIINMNKPLIEHFDIHVKEMKEGYPMIKHEVERVLHEVLSGY